MIWLVALVATAYGATTLIRLAAAKLWFDRERDRPLGERQNPGDVTILQPILSGDPKLEGCLRANLANHPDARFFWLIDDDDFEARRIADGIGHGAANLEVLIYPPPRDGENPKIAKLAPTLVHVSTPFYAVLDDDTLLPPDGLVRALEALSRSDLVTGLPVYAVGGGLWERLLAAFVNGSAPITYPPAALFGAARTLNGMFYVGRVATLRGLGGFERVREALTDDYAMARLHLDAGLKLVQSDIVHPISTTVPSARRYADIQRRWMIFANRYARENLGPFVLLIVAPSTLLPPFLLTLGIIAGPCAVAVALAILTGKAILTAALFRRELRLAWAPGDILLQTIADLLTPIHWLSALIAPRRFPWRSRHIRVRGESIVYE